MTSSDSINLAMVSILQMSEGQYILLLIKLLAILFSFLGLLGAFALGLFKFSIFIWRLILARLKEDLKVTFSSTFSRVSDLDEIKESLKQLERSVKDGFQTMNNRFQAGDDRMTAIDDRLNGMCKEVFCDSEQTGPRRG